MKTKTNITTDTNLDGARGTLGNLKRTAAVMGFDCQTTQDGNLITVTLTSDGAKVGRILSRADRTDDAAMVWA